MHPLYTKLCTQSLLGADFREISEYVYAWAAGPAGEGKTERLPLLSFAGALWPAAYQKGRLPGTGSLQRLLNEYERVEQKTEEMMKK